MNMNANGVQTNENNEGTQSINKKMFKSIDEILILCEALNKLKSIQVQNGEASLEMELLEPEIYKEQEKNFLDEYFEKIGTNLNDLSQVHIAMENYLLVLKKRMDELKVKIIKELDKKGLLDDILLDAQVYFYPKCEADEYYVDIYDELFDYSSELQNEMDKIKCFTKKY